MAPGRYTRNQLTNSKPVVLIIDEHEDSRIIVRTIAQHAGFEPVEAAHGRRGVELARERVPAVIVLDLDLVRGSSLDVLALLRQDATLAAVPVIATSPNAVERQALAEGFSGFVRKPISIVSLLDELQRLAPPLDA
jgi:CheY-like chemotaxis protein